MNLFDWDVDKLSPIMLREILENRFESVKITKKWIDSIEIAYNTKEIQKT